MAVLIIPTRGDIGAYFFKVELEGVVYKLSFQFNDREKHWYLDIDAADGQPIRTGIKLIANFPLLRTLIKQSRMPGELILVNSQSDADPDLQDLGSKSLLAYIEEGES